MKKICEIGTSFVKITKRTFCLFIYGLFILLIIETTSMILHIGEYQPSSINNACVETETVLGQKQVPLKQDIINDNIAMA